jgi:hypothetical protein
LAQEVVGAELLVRAEVQVAHAVRIPVWVAAKRG